METTGTYTPQPGDIGITTVHGLVGAAIGAAERLEELVQRWPHRVSTVFRHAFVYVGDGRVVEAEVDGARLDYLSRYDGEPMLWLRCPDPCRSAVTAAAVAMVGAPYSELDYVNIVLTDLDMPDPLLKDVLRHGGHEICSALCDAAAAKGGWVLYPDGRFPGDVTPVDLALLAVRQG